MSKLIITDIRAEMINTATIGNEDDDIILVRWIVEYNVYHNRGHYWNGTFYWNERNFIIDDVLAAIRKDLPK